MTTPDPKLVEAVSRKIAAARYKKEYGDPDEEGYDLDQAVDGLWPRCVGEAQAAIAVCAEYLAGECEARADEVASNWSQNKRPEEYYTVRRTIDILKAQANRIRELGGVGGGG